MSSSRFCADPEAIVVADASAVINLNATGIAAKLLAELPHRIVVTANAIGELEAGRSHGHLDADRLTELIGGGHVSVANVGKIGLPIYESLIAGPAMETLDDGEAATIACAAEHGGIALLDERKANHLCERRFASLEVVSTVELLLHPVHLASIGCDGQAEAIYAALQGARMRVPSEWIDKVVKLIGPERAIQCRSLPRMARAP